MRVSLVRAGGIAGLTTTTAVDSRSLSPEQARELSEQVERAGIRDLAARRRSSGPARPDEMHYRLEIDDGDAVHTATLSEEAMSQPVSDLIAFIDSVPEREESVGSPADAEP